MGYECGFEKVNAKELSGKEIIEINNYLMWKDNPWNFTSNNYPTYESWWNAFVKEDDKKYPGEPKNAQYEYHNFMDNIEYWCSSGFYIKDFIISNLKNIEGTGYYEGIDEQFVEKALKWAKEKLEENKLIRGNIVSSYKNNKEINVVLENGESILLEAGDEIYIPYSHYNSEEVETLKSFIKALKKIKNELKMSTVLFYESY